MAAETTQQDLQHRLDLIQSMIAEGRRKTENWGWSFVLWGVAYYVAIAWATWGHSTVAWPITMIATSLITGLIASRRNHGQSQTTMGRAIGAIWIGIGFALFLFCISLVLSGHAEQHAFLAAIEILLGVANVISGILLRWKAQLASGIAWCAAASATCFISIPMGHILFLAAIFLCQIVFGTYMWIAEARSQKAQTQKLPEKAGTAHA